MAYNLNRTGDNVADLLQQVEDKSIYSDATQQEHGLMSAADKLKIDTLQEVQYATTDFWNSCRGYAPNRGQIIVYSDYKTIWKDGKEIKVPGIKVGSGNAYIQDLAFVGEDIARDLLQHINNRSIHVIPEERAFWNSKLNVTDTQEVVGEALVFNRN